MGRTLKNVKVTDDEFVRSFIETCEKTGDYDNVGKRADMAIAYLDSYYDFGLPFSHIEALIEFVANGTQLKTRDEEREHMTREEKVRQAVQILEKGCRKYINNENYQKYLDMVCRFHSSSARNTMLILMQRPDASYVAPIGAWNRQFHRYVKKGEKGLSIFAPFMQKGPGGSSSASYTIVPVFDLGQTQGDPFPEKDTDLTLCARDLAPTLKALEAVSPCKIDYISQETGGIYDGEKNTVTVNKDLKSYDKAKAVIGAISEALVNTNESAQKFDEATRKVQAQGLSYVLCKSLGFDTDSFKFSTISSWSKDRESGELLYSLSVINKLSDSTLKRLESEVPFAKYELETKKSEEKSREAEIVPEKEAKAPQAPPKKAKKQESKLGSMGGFYDSLNKAQNYIKEYDENIKLGALTDVELLNTEIMIDDKKADMRLCANLYTNQLSIYVAGELLNTEQFGSIDDLNEKVLGRLSYENLFRYCYDIVQPMYEKKANTVEFSIYQIESAKNEALFRPLSDLDGGKINPGNYKEMYKGEVIMEDGSITGALDDIYRKFNDNKPFDFEGRSLSVSDIVILKGFGAFFVDDPGYKDVTQMLLKGDKARDVTTDIEKRYPLPYAENMQPINPAKTSMFINMYGNDIPKDNTPKETMSLMRALEDALEQNDNHFDGIINNLPPKVAQDLAEEAKKPTLSELEAGDVIRYNGAMSVVLEISKGGILLKDTDPPTYGGAIDMSEHEIIFSGWQKSRDFELLYKHDPAKEAEENDAIEGFRRRTYAKCHYIGNCTARDAEKKYKEAVKKVIREKYPDIWLRDVLVTGSRSRGAEEINEPLDITVSYEGSISEKEFLKALKAIPEPEVFKGTKVNLKPVRPEESGRISEYLKKDEETVREKMKEQSERGADDETLPEKGEVMVEINYSESGVLNRFLEERGSSVMSFALAEAILMHLDNHADHIGYDKTSFTVDLGEGGYSGRYDIGSEGYTLSEHIKDVLKYYANDGDKEAEKLYYAIEGFLNKKAVLSAEEKQELHTLMEKAPIIPFRIMKAKTDARSHINIMRWSDEDLMKYPGTDLEEKRDNARAEEALKLKYEDYDEDLMYSANLTVFEGSTTEDKLKSVYQNEYDIPKMRVHSPSDFFVVGSGEDMKAYYYDTYRKVIKERPLPDDIKTHLTEKDKEAFPYIDEQGFQGTPEQAETPSDRKIVTQKDFNILTEDYRSKNTEETQDIDLSGYEVSAVAFTDKENREGAFSLTLNKASVSGCTFDPAVKLQDLSGAKVINCTFTSMVFENTVFESAQIEGSTFRDCKFINCDMQGVALSEVTFDSCYFDRNDFLMASMEDVTFTPECTIENNQFNVVTVECDSAMILDTLRGSERDEVIDSEPNSITSLVTDAENTLENMNSKKERDAAKDEHSL